MARVIITEAAQTEFDAVPRPIRSRMQNIFARLANWPAVSGAKPLRGDLAGHYRIRTGDYRMVFTVTADGEKVTVWKIGNRDRFYDD